MWEAQMSQAEGGGVASGETAHTSSGRVSRPSQPTAGLGGVCRGSCRSRRVWCR